MTRARAQTWSKRSLSPRERVCDRIYTDAIADEIMKQLPRARFYDAEVGRRLLRSVIPDLESDLIRLSRPSAGSKRAALESLKGKLEEFCIALESTDDDSAHALLESARNDPSESPVDFYEMEGIDKGYARINGLKLLNRSTMRWIENAIASIDTEKHTGGKRRLDAERRAIAKLEVIWKSLSFNIAPSEEELKNLARTSLSPILGHYDQKVPDFTKAAKEIIYSAEWMNWPGKEAYTRFVKATRDGTNGVHPSDTPLVKVSGG